MRKKFKNPENYEKNSEVRFLRGNPRGLLTLSQTTNRNQIAARLELDLKYTKNIQYIYEPIFLILVINLIQFKHFSWVVLTLFLLQIC